MGESDLTSNMNQCVDLVLDGCRKEGVITEEQYEEMCHYRVVAHEHNFWGSLWNRIFKKTCGKDSWRFSVVRMLEGYDDYPEEIKEIL